MALEQELAGVSKEKSDAAKLQQSLAARTVKLRRDALLTANPLMQFEKLLLVKRNTYQSSHYYTED